MTEQKSNLQDFEREPVPASLRKPWYFLSAVWVAIGIDLSSMLLGSELGAGLSFGEAMTSVVVGSLILAIISAVCAYIGASTHLSTAMMTRSIFGEYGSRLVSVVIGISLLGWFGVQAGFFAENAQSVTADVLGVHLDVRVLAVIGGLLMMTTAIRGYRSIEKLSVVAVPLLVLLIFTALYLAFANHSADALFQGETNGEFTLGTAISLVIGIFIVGTVISPDVARWARTRKDAVLASFSGFLIGNSFMLIIAITLSKLMNTNDLSKIFISLGLGIPAILVLTLAQWTTNTNNLYSSALGFSVVFRKASKPLITFIAGLFATLLAFLGIFDHFIAFLTMITTLITPIGGIYIAEYFWVNKEHFSLARSQKVSKVIPRSLMAWLIASLFAFLTTPAPDGFGWFTLTTIPALDGILAGVIMQTVLGKMAMMQTREISHPKQERGL